MLRCLVADESGVVRKVARMILEGFEFAVTEAENGTEAISACQREMPDFILLDWQLPMLNGLDFLFELRSIDDGHKPKVVYCTSEADVAQIAKAMRAGADEYLLKPFDTGLVAAKLRAVGIL